MKLTKSIRESVIAKIKNKTYAVERKEFEAKIAVELDKILIAQGEIPASEIPEKFSKYISTYPECVVYPYKNNPYHSDRFFPRSKSTFCTRHNNRFEVENKEMVEQNKKIEDAWAQKEQTLQAVMNSCTTTKQLLETIPEMAEFLPEENQSMGGALVSIETVEKAKAIFAGIK